MTDTKSFGTDAGSSASAGAGRDSHGSPVAPNSEAPSVTYDPRPSRTFQRGGEPWTLVERYVERYPHDWRLIFKRGDQVLEVSVPEEVWRAFDA